MLRKDLAAKVERLGGSVTEEDQNFSHLVCLSPEEGRASGADAGFRKSFATLWALAAGVLL